MIAPAQDTNRQADALTVPRHEPHEAAMDSPCLKICVVDPSAKSCTGCGRTLAEIARWTSLSDAERRQIMSELPARLAQQTAQPVPQRGT